MTKKGEQESNERGGGGHDVRMAVGVGTAGYVNKSRRLPGRDSNVVSTRQKAFITTANYPVQNEEMHQRLV